MSRHDSDALHAELRGPVVRQSGEAVADLRSPNAAQPDSGQADHRLVGLRPLRPADLVGLAFLHPGASPEPPGDLPGIRWAASLEDTDPRYSGGWAIVAPPNLRALGLVIYHTVDARAQAAIISYALELEMRGQGIGTAAVGLALERLLGEIGFETLFADVELINVASRRMLHKLGFDPLTPGNTPGIQAAPDRPAQRWMIGKRQHTTGRSIINLGAVGPL